MVQIAAILTVHNRREKTLSCLRHLFAAVAACGAVPLSLSVFLTDDGCSDGTAEAVQTTFADKDIRIMKGTGSLFWAGGMRLAWQAAIDTGTAWDYFLLLNDDTFVHNNVFSQLFEAMTHGFHQSGRHGLVSGITCQPGCPEKITYGGFLFTGKEKGLHKLAQPTGKPQTVDMTHANILLVHSDVVSNCGIFYHGYVHSCADLDYSMTASSKGFPVMVTASVCGECECDHDTNKDEAVLLMTMTLAERKHYAETPTHSDHDYLLYVRRNLPKRYPMAWLLRKIRIYVPRIYYNITNFRGVYKL